MLSVLVPPLLFYILFSFAPEPSYFYICSLYSCLDLTSLTPIHVYNFSFTTLQAWFGRVPWWVLRSFVLIKGLCESIASLPRRLGPFTLLSRWRTFTDSTRVFHRFLFFFFFALAIVFTLPPAWWVVSFLLSYPLHCWIFLLCRLVCASIGVMTTLSCLNDDDDIRRHIHYCLFLQVLWKGLLYWCLVWLVPSPLLALVLPRIPYPR